MPLHNPALPDPLDVLRISDDFAAGNTTTGQIGILGWLFTAVGTGAISFVAGEALHPGILRLTTGATANSSLALYLRASPATGTLHTSDSLDVSFLARVAQTNADAEAIYRLGLGTNAATVPPDTLGLWLERLGGETNWFAVRRSATVDTRTDTTVAQLQSTWRRHRIQRVNATTIRYTVGGTAIDATTGLPTGVISPIVQIANGASGGAKTLDLDLFSLQIPGLARSA